jgi:hypothetical protein
MVAPDLRGYGGSHAPVRAATVPAGHFVAEEAPDLLAAELSAFLSRLER